MSNLYVFNSIVTFDEKTKNNYVLSLNNNKIELPFFQITTPRYLYNETRFNIKNLFKSDTIRFIEEIIISFMDVQNELLIEYVSQLNSNIFDTDNDLFILSSVILAEKIETTLYWNQFDYEINLQKPDIQSSIIDYSIQRSIV